MNIRSLIAAAVFALPLLIAAPGFAAPVTWDLQNVVFNDGGTASGSFVFDASTNTYDSWSITTTQTVNYAADNYYGLNGATYTTNNVTNASTNYYANPHGTTFKTLNSADSLALTFANILTGAGGTIGLTGSEYENFGYSSRLIASGSVSSVPLPASVTLFLTAMIGLVGYGAMKSRRTETRL